MSFQGSLKMMPCLNLYQSIVHYAHELDYISLNKIVIYWFVNQLVHLRWGKMEIFLKMNKRLHILEILDSFWFFYFSVLLDFALIL